MNNDDDTTEATMEVDSSTTTFSVRSKPCITSLQEVYISEILNTALSLMIYHVLLNRIFYHIIITSLLYNEGDSAMDITNDISNGYQNENLWRALFSPVSSLGVKVIIIVYHVLIMIKIGSLINSLVSSKAKTSQNVCQVQILPWGIQMKHHTIIANVDNKGKQLNSRIIKGKNIFLPLENISDIIVSEVILSYKVRNCLMFRVKLPSYENYTKVCDSNISLIPAFSTQMIDLSYKECIQLWQGMSEALSKYKQL